MHLLKRNLPVKWSIKDESHYYEEGDKSRLIECMTIIDSSLAALNDAFAIHGQNMSGKSEEEIKNFIDKVLGGNAVDIKVIKLEDEEE